MGPAVWMMRIWKIWNRMAYPEGSDIEQAFLNLISVMKISSPNIRIVPDPAAMIQAVSENVHAVGIIPLSAVNNSVREIPIQDLPNQADTVQVLAMTKGAPTTVQIEWINCVQNSLAELGFPIWDEEQ